MRETLSLDAIWMLLFWYALIVATAAAGFKLGSRISSRIAWLDETPADFFYRSLTAVALVGVAATYLSVSLDDLGLLWEAVKNQELNRVKQSLYTDYQPGFLTLRYVSALSGGVALARVFDRRRVGWIDLLNFILVGAAALLAARLLIVMAVLVAVGIVAFNRPQARLSVTLLIAGAFLFFIALTPLNYLRNAGTYEDRYGITNPFEMNASEFVTYLATPFQVAVGVADKDLREDNSSEERLNNALYWLTPTYLSTPPSPGGDYYDGEVEIDSGLATNSAFVSHVGSLGHWAFPFIGIVCFVAAAIAGHLFQYRSYVFLSGIALSYAFAELWRIFMFNQGIIHALVFVPILIAVCFAIWSRRRSLFDSLALRLRLAGDAE